MKAANESCEATWLIWLESAEYTRLTYFLHCLQQRQHLVDFLFVSQVHWQEFSGQSIETNSSLTLLATNQVHAEQVEDENIVVAASETPEVSFKCSLSEVFSSRQLHLVITNIETWLLPEQWNWSSNLNIASVLSVFNICWYHWWGPGWSWRRVDQWGEVVQSQQNWPRDPDHWDPGWRSEFLLWDNWVWTPEQPSPE